jgi:hypothetical protein
MLVAGCDLLNRSALAGSRTGTQTLRDAAAGLMRQWFLHGRR